MSTQISVLYTDQFQPFYQTVTTLQLFLWLEQNGEIIAGSQDAPQPIVMPQTGNTTADIMNGIRLALDAMTGDVGDMTYTPLNNFDDPTTYGISYLPFGNGLRNRPFVAIAYNESYDFGALNLPVPRDVTVPLVWKAYVKAISESSAETSPLYKMLDAYRTARGGLAPVLMVMELDPS